MTQKADAPAFSLPRGLGWWNAYFVAVFALAAADYLHLSLVGNAVLILLILLPLERRWARRARDLVALIAAIPLTYSESWLPGPDSLLTNLGGIRGFSTDYLRELIWNFINFEMLGWGLVICLAYLLLRRWLRVSVLVVAYFAFALLLPGIWRQLPSIGGDGPTTAAEERTVPGAPQQPGGTGPADSRTIDRWLTAFYDYEKERRAAIPLGLGERDTPFDILLLNICSLSNDDLEISSLTDHPFLSRFHLVFEHFNSATSYSGPATIRLLNMACGQPSHDDLYDNRPECQIMNRLGGLGYRQRLYMDHSGKYDGYLDTLRSRAGLTATLEQGRDYPTRYMGFNDEPIADTLSVLRHWLRTTSRDRGASRNVTLMNLIALHDGNRLPGRGNWEEFKPRAKIMLDQLQTFARELERSGRKVVLIMVPEHGAAVRGDRVQTAKLRDIPSMRITQVPVGVRFFGLRGLPETPIRVNGDTSYLALGDLIGRLLESDYFGTEGGSLDLDELASALPRTNPVSENAQSAVLSYRGRDYLRRGESWIPYPQ